MMEQSDAQLFSAPRGAAAAADAWAASNALPRALLPYRTQIWQALGAVRHSATDYEHESIRSAREAKVAAICSTCESSGRLSVPSPDNATYPYTRGHRGAWTLHSYASYTKHRDGSVAYVGEFDSSHRMHGSGAFYLPGTVRSFTDAQAAHPALMGTWQHGVPHGTMHVFVLAPAAGVQAPFARAFAAGSVLYRNGHRLTDASSMTVPVGAVRISVLSAVGGQRRGRLPWFTTDKTWDEDTHQECVIQ